MIVFAVTATRNQLCPSRSIRDAPVGPLLDDGAQKLTSERVHGLTHPQLRLLERLGTRVRAKLLVTDCDHLGDRLGDPGRHAGKIDGRGCRRAGH